MRLLQIVVDPPEVEFLSDQLWQLGAEGIWEQDLDGGRVAVRFGVVDASPVRLALPTRTIVDITARHAIELATRDVTITAGGRELRVEVPPTVFGDGTHPTTAACVTQLERLVQSAPSPSVLDVGCGTGVVSLAAAAAGAHVVAIDIDKGAASTTRTNADANGLIVDVSTTPLTEVPGRFDIVVANITAGDLLPLIPDLRTRTDDAGHLVVSGIWEPRWPEVREAVGWEVVTHAVDDGWVTATLRR